MSTIYFVTNRNPLPEGVEPPQGFGRSFNPNALFDIRFGEAEVGDVTGQDVPNAIFSDLDSRSYTAAVTTYPQSAEGEPNVLGSVALFERLRAAMSGPDGSDTVAFIHGFGNSFEDALVTGAQLKRVLESAPNSNGQRFNIVVFTWPSRGRQAPIVDYPRDRNHAAASGDGMARGIMKLIDYLRAVTKPRPDGTQPAPCGRSIHLVAHSMGNYALRHAVQGLRKLNAGPRLPRLFDKVMLMAADEDNDAFEHDHKLALLPELAFQVTVYFNREDLPLVISDTTKGQIDRLGSDGPRQPRNIPAKVSLVDCSTVITGVQEHHYYLNNAIAIFDMVGVLKGTRPDAFPPDRRRYSPETNSYALLDPTSADSGRRHRPNATLRRAER